MKLIIFILLCSNISYAIDCDTDNNYNFNKFVKLFSSLKGAEGTAIDLQHYFPKNFESEILNSRIYLIKKLPDISTLSDCSISSIQFLLKGHKLNSSNNEYDEGLIKLLEGNSIVVIAEDFKLFGARAIKLNSLDNFDILVSFFTRLQLEVHSNEITKNFLDEVYLDQLIKNIYNNDNKTSDLLKTSVSIFKIKKPFRNDGSTFTHELQHVLDSEFYKLMILNFNKYLIDEDLNNNKIHTGIVQNLVYFLHEFRAYWSQNDWTSFYEFKIKNPAALSIGYDLNRRIESVYKDNTIRLKKLCSIILESTGLDDSLNKEFVKYFSSCRF